MSGVRWVVVVLVVGASASACSSSETQNGGGCQSESDCKADEHCVDRNCVAIATDAGVDAAPDGTGDACLGKGPSPTAGRGCACPTDCEGQEFCATEAATGLAGGMCLLSCLNAPCPGNLVCLQTTPGAAKTEACFVGCNETADCPPSMICDTLEYGGAKVCSSFCQSDAECPYSKQCDRYSGTCAAGPPNPGAKDSGEACAQDSGCLSDFCITSTPQFPDGYCTAFCSLSKQGCPDGAYCAPIWGDADKGLCLKTCSSVDECRAGYACKSAGGGSGVKVCGPQ